MGQRLAEIDRDRPLIVVCRSGNRSLRVANQLSEIGYTDVKSMHGGLLEWAEKGYALTTQE
jgi:rhodanese-related sulfurtransferase